VGYVGYVELGVSKKATMHRGRPLTPPNGVDVVGVWHGR
jgi:hypothetical protein